jgi:hypothetical protein
MRSRTTVLATALGCALVLGWTSTATAATSPWAVVRSPNVGQLSNGLGGISALSPTEAWAVGTRQINDPGPDFRTLAEHWNGTSWSVATTPNGGTLARLNAVAEIATDDVWAVGVDYNQSAQAYQTLVEHFDGTSWTIVPSPNGGTRYDELRALAMVSPSNIWAVGMTQTSGSTIRNLTMIQHFDGTSWTIVPSPNRPNETDAWLLGVTATSANDVWAAGFDHVGTLAEHWNGTSWTIVASPNPVAGTNLFNAVTAIGPDDVWAVGESIVPGDPSRTLAEHWDGAAWTAVPTPNQGPLNNEFFGVSALSSIDVWAVGYRAKPLPEGGFVNRTVTQHWDGTAWTIVPSPNLGVDDVLLGMATTGPSTVFAVGGFTNPSQRTLVLLNAQG